MCWLTPLVRLNTCFGQFVDRDMARADGYEDLSKIAWQPVPASRLGPAQIEERWWTSEPGSTGDVVDRRAS
jgi:hypothetical protein